jgi:predicted HTH domain antitoxin
MEAQMSMVTVELEYDLVNLFHDVREHPREKLKEYLILELYRRHEISSGKAAEWLDMERSEFIRYAARLGVPYIDLDEIELQEEVRAAREMK